MDSPWCALLRAAWIRWHSVVISEAAARHCFSQCSTEQLSLIQNQSDFRATQRAGPTDKPLPSRPRKMSSPLVSRRRGARDFCNPEDPDAPGDDSSLFVVTQQQWRACVRRMLRCKLVRILAPNSLNPRIASGAFAVAKDEDRDRFTGDRRPLNSRERSIGRAHLPHCPRLWWLILGNSETVEITSRETKDCFYLDDVLPSRVTEQVIGPRTPRSWPERADDEN